MKTRVSVNLGGSVCLFLCGLLPVFGSDAAAAERDLQVRLDLNGAWQFRLDPNNEGVSARWFTAEVAYPDKIKVPGNWQAQGFGPSRGHLRHDYQGKAWYRRTAAVAAEWAGKRVWIHLGGVTNTGDVYVNSRKVGAVEGFAVPYEFDVTEAVRPGAENLIVCRVDSTGPAPEGLFNFIGRWGGLYRGVYLEARSDPAINDVFVIPDVKNRIARVQVTLGRTTGGRAWAGLLRVRVVPAGGGTAIEGQGPVAFSAGRRESEPATVEVAIPQMHTWSPEDPFLYRVEVALRAEGKVIDLVRDRFGMRRFEVDRGGRLRLNGRPCFVRGIGDDTVELFTGTQYPDKQIYVDRLKQIKRYGFNGVRFLANTPIPEYFEAADEVGVLVMAEGQIYHKPKEAIPLLKRDVTRIAKANRNHPSWYIWSSGNEFFECQGPQPERDWIDYIRYAHDTFKRVDPTRFFVASDGADVFPTDIITQVAKFHGSGLGLAVAEQPFCGLIEEVAYFRRALRDDELAKTADRGSGANATYAGMIRFLRPSGYWRLEEIAVGRALDSSGNNHHGIHDPTVSTSDLGQPGAFSPPGAGRAIRTGPGSKGVRLKDVAGATFAPGNDPFSVSLWIKPDGFRQGDYGTPFAYGAADQDSALLVSEDGAAGTGKLRLGRYGEDVLVSDGALVADQWNHIGITYDGSQLRLFLNGRFDKGREIKLTTVPADARIGGIVTALPPNVEEYRQRPYIWHEFPNTYVGPLPDLAIADKWTGVYQDPGCISHDRQQIVEMGLLERYPDIHRRSLDLFYAYLKDAFESARHSPRMDGYGYWLMTDWPGGPEGDMTTCGMFSTVYEAEKFPDPAPILQFNRETVLLVDAGATDRVLEAGKKRDVQVSVSHYGLQPIKSGRLLWKLLSGNEPVQQGTIEPIEVELGQVKRLGAIALCPSASGSARRLRLEVRLESEVCRQDNGWDFWVFPAATGSLRGRPIFNRTGLKAIDGRYGIDPKRPVAETQLVVANRVTPEVLDDLIRGKSVLLLAEQGALVHPGKFSFWPQWIRDTGTVIEEHPALARFPHSGFCDLQFFRLFDGSLETLDLTAKGSLGREKLQPVVWGLCQDYDLSLGSDWGNPRNRWKIFWHGILCEGRVGAGRIVLCSLRVLRGIERRQPEAGYLLDCLVEYALSPRFAPASPPITAGEFPRVFKMSASALP